MMLENSTNLERDNNHQRKKALKALELAKEVEASKTVRAVRLNNKTIVYRNVHH